MQTNSDRTRYKCTSCTYEFTRKSDLAVGNCPYCSKAGTLETLKGDFAAKMLQEVDKFGRDD